MAAASAIEWTGFTWNPVTGCTKVSPGCKHCYAEALANRLRRMGAPGYERGFAVTLHEGRLRQPLLRAKPTTWFVNSMSDLFHEQVPPAFVERVVAMIEEAPRHTFQILTKRPERMAAFFATRPVPANAWLGVSVEDRRYGLPRVAVLAAIDARVRFLSCEPLLEDLGEFDLAGVHWVIAGGESGPRARPMDPAWARRVRDLCAAAGVPFFFKQWGGRTPKAGGRALDGVEHDAMPAAANARG
jgi:protein gp37